MRDLFELENITIKINYESKKVRVMDYVTAKTKDLKEFGYTELTEKQVIESVWRIVNKEKPKDIIEHFIKDDIVADETG